MTTLDVKILMLLLANKLGILEFDDKATPKPKKGAAAAEGEGDDDTPVFELPEDLSGLSDEELEALHVQALEAFDAMRDGELSSDVLAAMNELAEAIETIEGEQADRTADADKLRADADALAQRVHGDEGGESEGGEGEGDAEGGDGNAEGTGEGEGNGEATAQAAADASTETGTEGGEGAAATTEGAEGEGAVTAGGGRQRRRIRVPLAAVGAHAPAAADTGDSPVVITAAADLPQQKLNMGAAMSTLQVASAMHARARNLSEGNSAIVASVHYPDLGDELTIKDGDDTDTITAKLNRAREIAPEALLAAGGWCTPSQFLYDLFGIEGTDGLVDLPTVGITRGGIQFVENGGPSIADVWAAPWLWTEAMDIEAALNPHLDPDDDVTKPCVRIPCPEWVEERLDAHGICITHGNLADRAYPEMTRRFLNLVMAAHAHIVNTRLLAGMEAASDAVAIAATFGAASALESAIDLQASDYRDKYRMDDGAVLEAVFPRWVRGVVRADISRRNAQPYDTVTNAQIAASFTARQIRPQFVYDWQPLQTGAGGADGFRETWPDTVKFMLYAAGTHVRGNGGQIDITVARDSVQNPVNDHTVAFTEEFILLAKMGHESRVVTVPIEPNGATGGQVAVAAIGA